MIPPNLKKLALRFPVHASFLPKVCVGQVPGSSSFLMAKYYNKACRNCVIRTSLCFSLFSFLREAVATDYETLFY
jgi:hypothetical protein